MRKTLFLSLLLVLSAIGAACNKGPARSAVEDAETAVAAIQADAEKYFPDQFQALETSLESLRGKFEEGQYAGVQMDSKMIRSRAEKLGELVTAKKQEVTEQWNGLTSSLPDLVAKVEAKVGELAALRRLPKGIEKAAVEESQAGLEEIKQVWQAAQADYEGGKPLDALDKALDVKAKLGQIADRIGFAPET